MSTLLPSLLGLDKSAIMEYLQSLPEESLSQHVLEIAKAFYVLMQQVDYAIDCLNYQFIFDGHAPRTLEKMTSSSVWEKLHEWRDGVRRLPEPEDEILLVMRAVRESFPESSDDCSMPARQILRSESGRTSQQLATETMDSALGSSLRMYDQYPLPEALHNSFEPTTTCHQVMCQMSTFFDNFSDALFDRPADPDHVLFSYAFSLISDTSLDESETCTSLATFFYGRSLRSRPEMAGFIFGAESQTDTLTAYQATVGDTLLTDVAIRTFDIRKNLHAALLINLLHSLAETPTTDNPAYRRVESFWASERHPEQLSALFRHILPQIMLPTAAQSSKKVTDDEYQLNKQIAALCHALFSSASAQLYLLPEAEVTGCFATLGRMLTTLGFGLSRERTPDGFEIPEELQLEAASVVFPGLVTDTCRRASFLALSTDFFSTPDRSKAEEYFRPQLEALKRYRALAPTFAAWTQLLADPAAQKCIDNGLLTTPTHVGAYLEKSAAASRRTRRLI